MGLNFRLWAKVLLITNENTLNNRVYELHSSSSFQIENRII